MRPLIFSNIDSISGGNKRLYEILLRAKGHGVDYVVVLDSKSLEKAENDFPRLRDTLKKYRVYITSIRPQTLPMTPGLRATMLYLHTVKVATFINRVADAEKVDLIVSPHEMIDFLVTSSIAGHLSKIPWSAILQVTPVVGTLTLEGGSVLRKVASNIAKLYHGGTVATWLRVLKLLAITKVIENTLMLSVSDSITRDLRLLNPKIKIHNLVPGIGVDFEKIERAHPASSRYDGIFFARLIPEKGLFDLPSIWRDVVAQCPQAKLVVAGVPQDQTIIDKFSYLVKRCGLDRNLIYVGKQSEEQLFGLIKSAGVFVYPTRLDAFPVGVMETLACGTPVVAYDIPAIRFNYHLTKAVIRVPVGDIKSMAKTVVMLTKDETLIKKLRGEARRFASGYSWDDVVEAEKQGYSKVIDFSASKRK